MSDMIFFLRLFRWFSLRQMRLRKWHVLTVLLGISLGAAVFTSVRLSVNASLSSFTQSMDVINGRTDQIILRPGGRISEGLVAPLLRHPGIRTASPILTSYIRLSQKDAEPFLLIGLDPLLDRPLRTWQVAQSEEGIVWMDILKSPYTLLIGEGLADQYDLEVGDTVPLEHARNRTDFRILGKLSSEGLAMAEGGKIAVTDIATFQEFTKTHGMVDRIDLLFKPDITQKQREGLRSLIPKDLVLKPASENRSTGQRMIRAYQLNLSVLSFASLFVGMFLVYSLVALNVASRRHEIAVMRSLGASSRLIFSIFIAEGFAFGLVGWIIAIPVSSFFVRYFLQGVNQTISTLFVRIQSGELHLNEWEILLSFGVTVLSATLAAFQPARESMKVPPKDAMSSLQQASGKRTSEKLGITGLILILAVFPLSKIPGPEGFPLPGYLAAFLLFTGFALISPWSLRQMGTRVAKGIRFLAGEPAHLAARYISDSGPRTAISVGALITAVALFASLVIMVHSFRQTLELWIDQTLSGDLFLRSKMAEINQFQDTLPVESVEILKNLRASVDLLSYRSFYLSHENHPYRFISMDTAVFFRYGKLFMLRGSSDAFREQLIQGRGVVVSQVFSRQTGLAVGDVFETRIQDLRLKLPILGVFRDYRTKGGVVYYSLPHLEKLLGQSRWTGVRIFFQDQDHVSDADISALQDEIVNRSGDSVEIVSGRSLRQTILQIFEETFAITSVLLIIALIVAALGITTTLTVLVLERSRQLNTLFAVGASFGQIRAMIVWEAVLMVLAGEFAGLVCGFILSYLLIFVINYASFGWTFLYMVNWTALLASFPLIILTALGAALPAIRVVFREPPATLLRVK